MFLTAPAKASDAVTATLLNKAKVGVVTITSTSEADTPCPFQQQATQVGCFVDSAKFERVTEQKYYSFTKQQLQDNAFIKNVRKKTFLNGKQYATGKKTFLKAKGTSIPQKMEKIIAKKTSEALESLKMTLNKTVKFLENPLSNFFNNFKPSHEDIISGLFLVVQGTAKLEERHVKGVTKEILTARISDCQGCQIPFTSWSPTAQTKNLFMGEQKKGVFLVGCRYKVQTNQNVSIQFGNGFAIGFTWKTPPSVLQTMVEQVEDYDCSQDKIISSLAQTCTSFEAAHEAYMGTKSKYIYVEVEAKIVGLSQNTFLSRKRMSDDKFKHNSYLTIQDDDGEKIELYAPVQTLLRLANISKDELNEDFDQARDDIIDSLMDFVDDEQSFTVMYSMQMSKQKDVPAELKDPSLTYKCLRDVNPIV